MNFRTKYPSLYRKRRCLITSFTTTFKISSSKVIQSKLPRFEGREEEYTLTIDTVYTLPLTLGASKIAAGADAIVGALEDYLTLCPVNANVHLGSSNGDGLAYQ